MISIQYTGLVVPKSDTSDNRGGVQEPSVQACQLVCPDLAIRRFIHGIHPHLGIGFRGKLDTSCRHPWENFVPTCDVSLKALVMHTENCDFKMRSASTHTSVSAPYNGWRRRNNPLSCCVHRWTFNSHMGPFLTHPEISAISPGLKDSTLTEHRQHSPC